MKNLEDIRGRCRITQDDCWLWAGSLRPDGRANIHAPDYTRGGMTTQTGARAAWHAHTQKPIPKGWRVAGCPNNAACCNPEHCTCAPTAKVYARIAKANGWKGSPRRVLANRAIGRKRSKLSASLIAEIQSSPETGQALAARLNLSSQVISKARRGEARAYQAANPFAGLMR